MRSSLNDIACAYMAEVAVQMDRLPGTHGHQRVRTLPLELDGIILRVFSLHKPPGVFVLEEQTDGLSKDLTGVPDAKPTRF